MAILNKRIQEQADAIDNHIIDALKSGAKDFIVKPFKPDRCRLGKDIFPSKSY